MIASSEVKPLLLSGQTNKFLSEFLFLLTGDQAARLNKDSNLLLALLGILIKFAVVLAALVGFFLIVYVQPVPLTRYLILAAGIFSIGVYGLLSGSSILKALISLELLFNSANVMLVAFSRYTDILLFRGQAFALFVMAVAAAEAALALAIAIAVYRLRGTTDLNKLTQLNG